MSTGGWIFLAVVVALIAFAIAMYNRLVALRNRFKNSFAQIDVQLKRRYDLIPNLVEAAKGYLQHERGTLEAVVAARGAAVSASQRAAGAPGDPAAMQGLAQAEGALGGALGRCSRPTLTSRRIRTSSRCRKSFRAPRTRSPSRARRTTTR